MNRKSKKLQKRNYGVNLCQKHTQRPPLTSLTPLSSRVVPCLTFGQLAEAMGEDCLMYGLAVMVPLLNIYCLVSMRGRIRDK